MPLQAPSAAAEAKGYVLEIGEPYGTILVRAIATTRPVVFTDGKGESIAGFTLLDRQKLTVAFPGETNAEDSLGKLLKEGEWAVTDLYIRTGPKSENSTNSK